MLIRSCYIRWLIVLFALFPLLLSSGGCASVPKESVELSYTIGKDLKELHSSHKLLIKRYFDSLRREINQAIDQVFIPTYINDYVKTGQLVQHAKNQREDLVEYWARIAVETIDKERKARLEPINKDEQELSASVSEAFERAIRANATVTAHLNSIRKVKEVQDEILESLEIKELRDKINDALVKASEKAKQITEKINKASTKIREKTGEANSSG